MMIVDLVLSHVDSSQLEYFILNGRPNDQSSLCASCGPGICCFQPIPLLPALLKEALAHPHSTPCLVGGQEAQEINPSVRQGFTFKQTKCIYCCKHRGNERLSQKINFSSRCQAKSHPGYKKLGLSFVSKPWSGTALGRPVFRMRSRGFQLMDPVGGEPEMIHFSLL